MRLLIVAIVASTSRPVAATATMAMPVVALILVASILEVSRLVLDNQAMAVRLIPLPAEARSDASSCAERVVSESHSGRVVAVEATLTTVVVSEVHPARPVV